MGKRDDFSFLPFLMLKRKNEKIYKRDFCRKGKENTWG